MEADAARAALQHLEIEPALRRALGVVGGERGIDLPLERGDLVRARPVQRDAPGQAVAHGAHEVEIGWGAGDGEAGARELRRFGLLEPRLDQVGKLEILEEEIEELLLGQHELEGVLLAAILVAGAAAPAAIARGRALDAVADDVFLVAGDDVVALAAMGRAVERRLGDAAARDRDLLAAIGLADLAPLQRVDQGLLHLASRPIDEALPVG